MTTFAFIGPVVTLLFIGFFFLIGRARLSFARTRQVMGVYLVLLLASLTVFYAMAESSQTAPAPIPERGIDGPEWDEYNRISNEYYNAVFEGRVEEYEGAELVKEWDFDYTKEQLLLTTSDSRPYYIMIVIEEKAADDGKVEVKNYTISMEDFETYFGVNPPDVRLAGDVLEIIRPERMEIVAVRFFQDFTSAQFTGKGLNMDSRFHFYHGDHQVLYIKIPPNLQVDTDESTMHNISYVNK